ncbi:coiled-coil-helix-coiled-coil-helix domain containing 3a isoform X1 [Pseudochaenichthys georgianus]|uniref:coiled-coil-helix-coiled-coil-helix domain containing 3a isoform X1 n=1 Tax=Pseudochaenichthys georgianus TaxID=52239 RepID=UPI00146A8F26|nr:coiled-coil-helix-coiled-coil-helix domain containing 3a isoform X2 [Pseudochaenichthys georgianus]
MGANNSTRRVSFESDENENVSVVKGIRLSENVINRMREPEAPPKAPPKVLPAPSSPPSMTPTITPSPFIRPVPPIFAHITPLPPLPSLVAPVAPPPAPSTTETVAAPPPPAKTPTEQVAAPTIIDMVLPTSSVPAPAFEPVAAPPPPAPAAVVEPVMLPPATPIATQILAPCPVPAEVEVITPLAPPNLSIESSPPAINESIAICPSLIEAIAAPYVALAPPPPVKTEPTIAPPVPELEPLSSPPVSEPVTILPQTAEPFAAPPLPEFTAPCEPVAPPPQPPVEPASPVPEPVVVPEVILIPPPAAAAAPPVDEVALRKTITDELHKDMEQDRAKAEQELQAWVETEKARAAAHAQDDAQSQVQGEVSRILCVERAAGEGSIQQAVIRERIATEDERLRAQLFAKQLGAREADLKKQDAFYREQVARLEERSAQFYKVTTENYHKAADQVNSKFRRYETYPVCADLQGQILACYKENVGKTLNCSNIATLYLQCVNNTKQNDKDVHAPSWTDDITS